MFGKIKDSKELVKINIDRNTNLYHINVNNSTFYTENTDINGVNEQIAKVLNFEKENFSVITNKNKIITVNFEEEYYLLEVVTKNMKDCFNIKAAIYFTYDDIPYYGKIFINDIEIYSDLSRDVDQMFEPVAFVIDENAIPPKKKYIEEQISESLNVKDFIKRVGDITNSASLFAEILVENSNQPELFKNIFMVSNHGGTNKWY